MEEIGVTAILVDQKLHSARVVEMDRFDDGQGRLEDALSKTRVQVEGGRDFDNLLMSPLQGAIPLVQVNEISMLVAEKLNFDMSSARNVLFQEDRRVAEGSAGLAPGLLQGVVEAIGAGGDAHAAPAPAHGCLDDPRVAQRTRQPPGFGIGRFRFLEDLTHPHFRFLPHSLTLPLTTPTLLPD